MYVCVFVCVCVYVWKEIPPNGTGPFHDGLVSGLQSRIPAPFSLVLPLPEGEMKRGGGICKRMGWAPLLTGRGGGQRRLPTGGESH